MHAAADRSSVLGDPANHRWIRASRLMQVEILRHMSALLTVYRNQRLASANTPRSQTGVSSFSRSTFMTALTAVTEAHQISKSRKSILA